MKSKNPVLIKILELKEQKFKTDKEFEEFFKIKPKTIDSWKRDLSKSFMEMLTTFAQYFNVSTDYLLGLTEVRTTALPDNAQIMPDGWEELDKTQKNIIMELVRSSITEFKRIEEEQNQNKIKNSL